MDALQAEAQVEGFIARYEDALAAQIRAARVLMRQRLPSALELVYDNYNALAIAYSVSDRQAGIICSIAAYPRWISLFLVNGPRLHDPGRLLKGEGDRVRHVVLRSAEQLEEPAIAALLDQAVALAPRPPNPDRAGWTIVKSISAKQRPRRPLRK